MAPTHPMRDHGEMGANRPRPDEAAVEPRQLLRRHKAQSLATAAVGLVALVIGLVLGEDGGPWWSFSLVLAMWAMPAVQLWRSTRQLDGALPRLPTRPARHSWQPRYLALVVLVLVVLSVALLATEPQSAVATVAVGAATYGLLRRVEALLGRHCRRLVVATRSGRFVPWVTYRWGEAEGREQLA